MENLTDIQWCALDLLMRSKQKGCPIVSRSELLHSSSVPEGVRIKIVWALLTMPDGLVTHRGYDFEISDKGMRVFNAMFKKPSTMGDVIIALPDNSRGHLQ